MNTPVTVRDVMTRSYVGVNEGDPVSGAAALMRDEGVNSAVVLRGREAAGVLNASDVIALVADAADPEATPVGDAMTRPVVSIDADSGLDEAVSALADNDTRRIVVTENGDVAGVLSEHDIIAAHAMRPAGLDEQEPTPAADAIDGPLAVDDEFAAQSVCEVCGSLADTLTNRNGQLVCADCVGI